MSEALSPLADTDPDRRSAARVKRLIVRRREKRSVMAEHVVDLKRHDACVLSVEAGKLRAAGDLPAAMAKMRQASQRDKTYSVRAELLTVQDRPLRKTLRGGLNATLQ